LIAINSHNAVNEEKGSATSFAAAVPLTTVAFVVSGNHDSPMGYRAREMASRLSKDYEIQIVYRSHRKLSSILTIFTFLRNLRPDVIYVYDISYTAVMAAALHKLLCRSVVIVETGDAIAELARSSGSRGRLGILLTNLLEKAAFALADRVVVRGTFHKELLSTQGIDAEVIQDAVDVEQFRHQDVSELRKQLRLDGVLTVGLIGSSIWSEKLQMCYGWDLVETVHLLKDKPVKGIMIGGGSGIAHLQARCGEYGIEDKILFLGQLPFDKLPRYLRLIDVCLSTQTNDSVGKVRTTGKLPLYLAAGRYILASKVGEAALVLDDEMLIDYEGVKDQSYPQKLGQRIETILDHPEVLRGTTRGVALAKAQFDYGILAGRMGTILEATIRRKVSTKP
jgi:glycosyltransferase involved in cell wall biosynthesis